MIGQVRLVNNRHCMTDATYKRARWNFHATKAADMSRWNKSPKMFCIPSIHRKIHNTQKKNILSALECMPYFIDFITEKKFVLHFVVIIVGL